jgi:hypothetical protein
LDVHKTLDITGQRYVHTYSTKLNVLPQISRPPTIARDGIEISDACSGAQCAGRRPTVLCWHVGTRQYQTPSFCLRPPPPFSFLLATFTKKRLFCVASSCVIACGHRCLETRRVGSSCECLRNTSSEVLCINIHQGHRQSRITRNCGCNASQGPSNIFSSVYSPLPFAVSRSRLCVLRQIRCLAAK